MSLIGRPRRRDRGDGGNVLVLFGVMMTVFLGIGALVVDLGVLHAEGRQLQIGAENAALAVAKTCATGPTCDESAAPPLADTNANDTMANVDLVCGTGSGLTGCTSAPQRPRYDCLPLAADVSSVPYAEVRTSTEQPDGSTLMPRFLFRGVDASDPGTTVRACARASWGSPLGLTSQLPLTISKCEYLEYTSSGFVDPTTLHSPWPAGEAVIHFHGHTDEDEAPPCPAGPSGADLPGGFGWLDTDEDCVATTDAEGWVGDSTGAPPPSDCSSTDLSSMIGKVVHIPIFGNTNDLSGINAEYQIEGYAAFFLTGYYFTDSSKTGYRRESIVTGKYPCIGKERCISGYFTTAVTSGGPIGSGPSMGVTIIAVTG